MGGEWTHARLGNLVAIKHGWPFKSELFSLERLGRPIVVSIGNFQYTGGFRFESTAIKEYAGEYPRDYELAPGDILLVMTCQTAGGEILGVPARVPNDGRVYLHNQRLGLVVPRDQSVDAGFLYWLFLCRDFNQHLVSSASGTKILHTAPSRIESFEFNLPPLAEQRAIARILGALDDKIELNRKMTATLEAMARALFKSWFVDFDPVRAKAEGRTPAGMDAETAKLFPSEFVESELGPIPNGWRAGNISDVASNRRDTVHPKDAAHSSVYIGLEHLPRGRVFFEETGTPDDLESLKAKFSAGEVLFGKLRPYFKKVAVAPCKGICSTDILVLSPHRSSTAFVALLAASDPFIEHAVALSDGTRMPRTSWEQLTRFAIAVPTAEARQAFDDHCLGLFQEAEVARQQSMTLARLRDQLLPRMLSGELDLSAGASAVEGAL